MKILVTGRNGQVARALAKVAATRDDVDVRTVARPEADLAVAGSMGRAIRAIDADVVINAAAYTAVDAAETEPKVAQRINADGAGEVAEAAAAIGAGLIQISTDYVFDGRHGPYREQDPTGPLNVYGKTKLAGEQAVLKAHPTALVVRTGWVVSPWGHNFVRTMLRLAEHRDEIAVVDDQKGCPTSAIDLADALLRVIELGPVDARILHLVGSGEASWAEVAEEVMRASHALGGLSAHIRRIPSKDYPTAAARPPDTRLSMETAAAVGIVMPVWRGAVDRIVETIARQR